MLKKILIENFKSIKEQQIDLSPITILIGPNRSGKSSILQALSVLKGFVTNPSRPIDQLFDLHLVNLGSIKNVVHRHRDERTILIGAEISSENYDLQFSLQLGSQCSTSICWKKPFQAKAQTSISLPWSPRPERTPFKYQEKDFTFVWDGLNAVVEPKPDPELADLIDLHKEEITNMQILLSNRGFMKPTYQRQAATLPPTMTITEDQIASLLDDVDFETTVQTWTNEVFGVRVESKTTPPNISLFTRLRHFAPNIVNEGFGLNQATYMFSILAAAKEGSLIGIEEPEISLHPKAQSKLASVFIEAAEKMSKYVVITTHSEHLLVALLTRIAKGELAPDHLALYSMERKGDTSRANRLEINDKGQVEGGIKDFFEHDLSMSLEYIEALTRGSK